MRFSIFIFTQFLVITILFSVPTFAEYNAETWEDSSLNLADWINKNDPAGPKYNRPRNDGLWLSKYGMQFSKSCLPKNKPKIEEEEIDTSISCDGTTEKRKFKPRSTEDKLNSTVEIIAGAVRRCGQRYPELAQPYLQDVVKFLRRTVVVCEDKMDEGVKGYTKQDPRWPTIHLLKSEVLNSYKSSRMLFHELLHNTYANAQTTEVHNALANSDEYQDDSTKDFCSADSSNDRIYAIADLCFSDSGTWRDITPSLFLKKFNRCGSSHCRKVFTGSVGGWGNLDGKGLSEDTADMVCRKIKEDGQCDSLRYSESYRQAQLRAHPDWSEISNKTTKRIKEALPAYRNEIPLPMIESFSEISILRKALDSNRCFKEAFKVNERGGTILSFAQADTNPINDPAFTFSGMYTPQDHVMSLRTTFETWAKKYEACALTSDRQQILNWFSLVSEYLGVMEKNFLRKSVLSFAQIGSQDIPSIIPWTKPYGEGTTQYQKSCEGRAIEMWQQLLGKPLWSDLENFSKKADPGWPDFNCEDLGLNPIRSGQRAVRELKALGAFGAPITGCEK